ncbi:hypothetical protein H8E88_19955 [candidate division KSB1 bacterium]|nr:hypothetical protein [candidate division KSB1 bacterium]MBL7093897.1 hypothetical protein [candidate division KSB1 bacterium]
MIPIYLIPIIFMLLLFIYNSWEYNRLKAISVKLDKILKDKKLNGIKFYRSHSSIFSFDKIKLVTKIEKQLDLLLKNYNLSFLSRRYSRWSIQFNSGSLYESFNRKLDKILNHIDGDKITFTRHHHFRLLFNSIKILEEINKKLDKIHKHQ